MHYGDDEQVVFGILVDHGKGEAVGKTTAGVWRKGGPSGGKAKNTCYRAANFGSKFKAEARKLIVVVIDCIPQFGSGSRKERYRAGMLHFASPANTSSAGMAVNSPR